MREFLLFLMHGALAKCFWLGGTRSSGASAGLKGSGQGACECVLAVVGHSSSRDTSVLSVYLYWCGPDFRRLFDTLYSVMTKIIVTCNSTGRQILSALVFRREGWVLILGE